MFVVLRITNLIYMDMDYKNLKPANMDIKVLGTGCAKCKNLEKVTNRAVEELGIDATVSKVEDIVKIMEFGVMTTPALVVDGKVVHKGSVPKLDEVKAMLQ